MRFEKYFSFRSTLFFTMTAVFIMIFLPLFADYDSDVQNGNDAYKAKDWAGAADYYKSAYVVKQDPVVKKALDYCVSMTYQEDLAKAYAAYKAKQTEVALNWYKAAYSIYPTKQVEDFIAKLEGQAQPVSNIQAAVPKHEEASPVLKWGLLAADAVLATYSIITYIDANNASDDYNNLYGQINNTSIDNYNMLANKFTDAENKQNLFGTVAAITSVLVVYTLADAVLFHEVFPKDTALNIDYKANQFVLVLKKEF